MSPFPNRSAAHDEGQSAENDVTASRGLTLRGVSLVDVLQMVHTSRLSVTLELPAGVLHLREGEVIHAVCATSTGEEALRTLLELDQSEVGPQNLEPAPVSVRRPLSTVLLDALVAIEETGQKQHLQASSQSSPSELFAEHRSSQLDAVCAGLSSRVVGALCCGFVDLERGVLLGFDQRLELPVHTSSLLLDTALDLFSGAALTGSEEILGADHASETQELQILHGSRLYVGKRLGRHCAVLLLVRPSEAPLDHLARLRSLLEGSAP